MSGELTVRPFAPTDRLAVLFGQSLHGQGLRTLVAECDGHPVGAATCGRNPIHPGRYPIAVEVLPAYRRRGIATALLAGLRRIRPRPLPFAAKVRPDDAAATGLLAALGGRVYQRCPGVRPVPTALRSWCADQSTVDRLRPMTSIGETDRMDAWIAMYLWVHANWSPADPVALREAGAEIMSDLDPALSVCATRAGRICAAAWVFHETSGGVTVVAETLRAEQPDGVAMVAATLAECVRGLDRAGVHDVLLDGHESDPHLFPVMHTLPPAPADPLLLVEIP